MASSTNFSGVGSGIDFSVITDSIIARQSRPLVQLATKQNTYKNRAEALKQLNAKVIALKDAATALTDRTLSQGRFVASGSPTVATATVTNAADLGALNLEVIRTASQQTQASDGVPSLQTGILAGGAATATFELRKGGATTGTALTIDAGTNSLAGLRDAINAAQAGVTATIVDVGGNGTQNQLVLTSTETGSAGRVSLVETSATGTAAALNLRNVNPPSGTATDLDAAFKVNGLPLTRSTNTVSDAVVGVTFSLKTAGTTSLTVSSNSLTIKNKIETLAGAYNDLQDFISGQYKPDGKGRPTGILAGDVTLRSLQQNLRASFNEVSTGNGGAFTELAQLGFGRDETDHIKIDDRQLSDRLAAALGDVQALFSGKTGSQTGLAHLLAATGETLSASLQQSVTGYTDSVSQIDRQIANQQVRIDKFRAVLTRRFSIADAAIGQLNGQSTALASVLKSLEPKNN